MKFEKLFVKLSTSKFRSKFRLGKKELLIIETKTFPTLETHAFDLITKRLADANPSNDGKQTPYRGHPVFVAQHATATCCRSCLLKWHRIGKNKALTETEIKYIVEVIMTWISRHAPQRCEPGRLVVLRNSSTPQEN